jgi:hypothetical protein
MVISVYYCIIQTGCLYKQLHATCCAALVLYSLLRHYVVIDDMYIFLVMHIAQYIIVGQPLVPHWVLVYLLSYLIHHFIYRAELRVYTMVSELHRVLPTWGFDFVYTHEAMPRANIRTFEQQEEQDQLIQCTALREKGEVLVCVDAGDERLWRLSDNHSLFIPRWERRVLLASLTVAVILLYALWWRGLVESFEYYFIVDCLLFLTHLLRFTRTKWSSFWQGYQLLTSHLAFAGMTIYLALC